MLRIIALVLLLLTAAAWPAAAEYPERPLTILTGYPPGGMVDITVRPLAEGLKKKFPEGRRHRGPAGRRRLAGGGRAGPGQARRLHRHPGAAFHAWSSTPLNELPYKTPDDYEAIINVVSFFSLLVVKPDAPWKTMQELIAASKASPGKLRVGTPGRAPPAT